MLAGEKKKDWSPILSLNSVYPTTSYSSTPGRSAIAWVDSESMILHRLIISWVCNHLIKLRRAQGNGSINDWVYSVREYWVSGILASSWFYCISTSWKKRQCHIGFFREIDDLWEAGSIHLPQGLGCDARFYIEFDCFYIPLFEIETRI